MGKVERCVSFSKTNMPPPPEALPEWPCLVLIAQDFHPLGRSLSGRMTGFLTDFFTSMQSPSHCSSVELPWGKNDASEGCESKRAGIVCYSFVPRNWSRQSAYWTNTGLPSWCGRRTRAVLDLVALDNFLGDFAITNGGRCQRRSSGRGIPGFPYRRIEASGTCFGKCLL